MKDYDLGNAIVKLQELHAENLASRDSRQSKQTGALHQDRLENRELRKRRPAAADENQELQFFLQFVSHDLRGPLRQISAHCQMLAFQLADVIQEETADALEMMSKDCQRVSTLIDEMTTLARLDGTAIKTETCDLQEIVDECLATYKDEFEQRDLNITCQPLPSILGNRTLMHQVIDNLVRNSLSHGGSPLRIAISCIDDSKHTTIRFSSNVTRCPVDLSSLFKPFERGKSSNGAGWGLTICQKIIEAHGGQIWLESSGETFDVNFYVNAVIAGSSNSQETDTASPGV